MNPFRTITSRLIPMPITDIDTDQIIPARYLKVTDKEGLAEGLFAGWRYLADGSPDPVFPLNRLEYQGAQFLLAGDNFGCGSSREHAPWALASWGIRAVISASFADIFCNNALKNGLLPIVLEKEELAMMFELAREDPTCEVRINLQAQKVRLPDGREFSFPIDEFNKVCLYEGLDHLGYLLRYAPEIAVYERAHGLV
jgi:3-isopropylmalate/(R)-2-methylmalate dehydratase small subunit